MEVVLAVEVVVLVLVVLAARDDEDDDDLGFTKSRVLLLGLTDSRDCARPGGSSSLFVDVSMEAAGRTVDRVDTLESNSAELFKPRFLEMTAALADNDKNSGSAGGFF